MTHKTSWYSRLIQKVLLHLLGTDATYKNAFRTYCSSSPCFNGEAHQGQVHLTWPGRNYLKKRRYPSDGWYTCKNPSYFTYSTPRSPATTWLILEPIYGDLHESEPITHIRYVLLVRPHRRGDLWFLEWLRTE